MRCLIQSLLTYIPFSRAQWLAEKQSQQTHLGPIDRFSMKISFAKGWGNMYRRQDVMGCPCWLEVHFNHLRWQFQLPVGANCFTAAAALCLTGIVCTNPMCCRPHVLHRLRQLLQIVQKRISGLGSKASILRLQAIVTKSFKLRQLD